MEKRGVTGRNPVKFGGIWLKCITSFFTGDKGTIFRKKHKEILVFYLYLLFENRAYL